MTYSEYIFEELEQKINVFIDNISKKIHMFIKNKASEYIKPTNITREEFKSKYNIYCTIPAKDILTKEEILYLEFYDVDSWSNYKQNCKDPMLINDPVTLSISNNLEKSYIHLKFSKNKEEN